MRVFVATRPEQIPADARPFVSVDGTVPGAVVTWDHHVTGEPVNLDAMPPLVEIAGLRGVGTTLADTDALASVVAVLHAGKARLPDHARAVLYAASYRCDHLMPAPGVDDDTDRAGAALHRWVSDRLAATEDRRGVEGSNTFEALCRDIDARVREGRPLPGATAPDASAAVAALFEQGRVTLGRSVACFDLRDVAGVPPEALHAAHDLRVAIVVRTHPEGGVGYTVGVNPFHVERPVDLHFPLAALAAAEHRHGPPCRAPEPVPGAENWGGRATVFGSPWNYGSRLTVEEVVRICEASLG